jgi:hypothetical protein
MIQFGQFAYAAFTKKNADAGGSGSGSGSGSGQGVKPTADGSPDGQPNAKKSLTAPESIEAALRAMPVSEERLQEILALIHSTPLYKAFLIDGNQEAKDDDYPGWTPLHLAAKYGHLEVVRLLFNRGAQVNALDIDNETPLYKAVEADVDASHLEVIGLLLDLGAKVDAPDHLGRSPLHRAAYFQSSEVIKLLLSQGAKVDAPDHVGQTPLDEARRALEENCSLKASDEERLRFQNVIDLLEHQTAFHQRSAVELRCYIYQGKSIDLDLMKANLKHTEYYGDVKLLRFLELLQVQAMPHIKPGVQVTVVSGEQEERMSVEAARQQVSELVRFWIQEQQQSLQALQAFQQGHGGRLSAHLEQAIVPLRDVK